MMNKMILKTNNHSYRCSVLISSTTKLSRYPYIPIKSLDFQPVLDIDLKPSSKFDWTYTNKMKLVCPDVVRVI